jgi:hypothetical protein
MAFYLLVAPWGRRASPSFVPRHKGWLRPPSSVFMACLWGALIVWAGRTMSGTLWAKRRWDDIEWSLGTLAGSAHDWDADPAAWVRAQRQGDARRTG